MDMSCHCDVLMKRNSWNNSNCCHPADAKFWGIAAVPRSQSLGNIQTVAKDVAATSFRLLGGNCIVGQDQQCLLPNLMFLIDVLS